MEIETVSYSESMTIPTDKKYENRKIIVSSEIKIDPNKDKDSQVNELKEFVKKHLNSEVQKFKTS